MLCGFTLHSFCQPHTSWCIVYKVCSKSIRLFVLNTQHKIFFKFYIISFKIFPFNINALFPSLLPLLESPLKLLFQNAPQLLRTFLHNLLSWLKPLSFKHNFEFRKWPKIAWHQIRRIRSLSNKWHAIFCKKFLNDIGRMSRIIIVIEPKIFRFSHAWPFFSHCYTKLT